MWARDTRQASQLTFLPAVLLERPPASKEMSARVCCKLSPVLAFRHSKKNPIVLHGVMWTNGGEVPDQRKPNARHVRARRWWMQQVPRASCTTRIHWHGDQKLPHPSGLEPLKTRLDGRAVNQWGSGVGRVLRWTLSQRQYQQGSSQIDTSAAVTQSGGRAERGHNKVD